MEIKAAALLMKSRHKKPFGILLKVRSRCDAQRHNSRKAKAADGRCSIPEDHAGMVEGVGHIALAVGFLVLLDKKPAALSGGKGRG